LGGCERETGSSELNKRELPLPRILGWAKKQRKKRGGVCRVQVLGTGSTKNGRTLLEGVTTKAKLGPAMPRIEKTKPRKHAIQGTQGGKTKGGNGLAGLGRRPLHSAVWSTGK